VRVRDARGRDLGVVEDVYRTGETEVFVVRGGLPREFDVPAVRTFILVFDPRGGEIVVDADALGLDADALGLDASPAAEGPS